MANQNRDSLKTKADLDEELNELLNLGKTFDAKVQEASLEELGEQLGQENEEDKVPIDTLMKITGGSKVPGSDRTGITKSSSAELVVVKSETTVKKSKSHTSTQMSVKEGKTRSFSGGAGQKADDVDLFYQASNFPVLDKNRPRSSGLLSAEDEKEKLRKQKIEQNIIQIQQLQKEKDLQEKQKKLLKIAKSQSVSSGSQVKKQRDNDILINEGEGKKNFLGFKKPAKPRPQSYVSAESYVASNNQPLIKGHSSALSDCDSKNPANLQKPPAVGRPQSWSTGSNPPSHQNQQEGNGDGNEELDVSKFTSSNNANSTTAPVSIKVDGAAIAPEAGVTLKKTPSSPGLQRKSEGGFAVQPTPRSRTLSDAESAMTRVVLTEVRRQNHRYQTQPIPTDLKVVNILLLGNPSLCEKFLRYVAPIKPEEIIQNNTCIGKIYERGVAPINSEVYRRAKLWVPTQSTTFEQQKGLVLKAEPDMIFFIHPIEDKNGLNRLLNIWFSLQKFQSRSYKSMAIAVNLAENEEMIAGPIFEKINNHWNLECKAMMKQYKLKGAYCECWLNHNETIESVLKIAVSDGMVQEESVSVMQKAKLFAKRKSGS